jgi:hypothetical protein
MQLRLHLIINLILYIYIVLARQCKYRAHLPKDITVRASLTICTHALVQLTSMLHLTYVHDAQMNYQTYIYIYFDFFHCCSRKGLVSVPTINLLPHHHMMCVPADKQHTKIH